MSNGLFMYDTALLPHRFRQRGAPWRREWRSVQHVAFRCREIVISAHAPWLCSEAGDDCACDFNTLAVEVAVIAQPRTRGRKLPQEERDRRGGLAVDADQRCASARELASGQRNNGWGFTDENCATLERRVLIEPVPHQAAQRGM